MSTGSRYLELLNFRSGEEAYAEVKKLASGLSAAHRLRDLADVQDLIIVLNLPLELRERLDESVRAEYTRMWEAARGALKADSSSNS